MISRDDIQAFARTLIGRKYRAGLNTKTQALDCVGVITEVAKAFGFVVPDQIAEGLPKSYRQAHEVAARYFEFVDEPLPGDFLIVNVCSNVNAAGRVHFGLITDGSVHAPRGMIYTDASIGRVVEGKFDKRFLRHQHEFCRFAEVI